MGERDGDRRCSSTWAQEISVHTSRPTTLIGVHRALIGYVRERLAAGNPDRRRLARQTRDRGEAALALLADQLGRYVTKP